MSEPFKRYMVFGQPSYQYDCPNGGLGDFMTSFNDVDEAIDYVLAKTGNGSGMEAIEILDRIDGVEVPIPERALCPQPSKEWYDQQEEVARLERMASALGMRLVPQ